MLKMFINSLDGHSVRSISRATKLEPLLSCLLGQMEKNNNNRYELALRKAD